MLNYWVNIEKIDNCTQTPTALECEDSVKCLGVLLDSNLSWKFHFKVKCCIKSKQNCWCCCPSHVLPFKIFINLWYCLIWHTVWWLWVKLPKPIYKKNSRATKTSPSDVWRIFLNPEHRQWHYFIPQTFYLYKMLYAEKVFSIMFDVF